MSESTIPFQGGGTALLEPPAPDLGPEPGDGKSRSTALLALGGVALVLVLGLVAYFLVFTGDDAAEAPAEQPPAAAGPEGPVEQAEPPATAPKLSQRNFGRDPFKPLISEPVAAVAPVAPDTSAGAGTAATSGSTTTVPQTSTPESSTAHTFRVTDVAPDNSSVTVKVDGEVYRNLKAGDVFAKHFKVLLISGQVNSFQYGDEKFNVIGDKKLSIA